MEISSTGLITLNIKVEYPMTNEEREKYIQEKINEEVLKFIKNEFHSS